MAEVHIPFRLFWWDQLLLTGRKTATTRTRRYGRVGDTFQAAGAVFRLTEVYQVPLAHVRDNLWRQEGSAAPACFERVWCQLHPGTGFQPDLLVWVHRFERVGKGVGGNGLGGNGMDITSAINEVADRMELAADRLLDLSISDAEAAEEVAAEATVLQKLADRLDDISSRQAARDSAIQKALDTLNWVWAAEG